MVIRVAVIGAGAGGLCAMRHLLAKPKVFHGVCFEQGTQVGGTWIYRDDAGMDKYGLPIHSSMYKNLKTNLPKEIMQFPGFPFKKNLPSFVKHEDVFHYLQDFSEHYTVTENILFQTVVTRVHPQKDRNNQVTWEVTYSDVHNQSASRTQSFDGVVVCNGHYSVPIIPSFPGLDRFKGRILHSHEYRRPDAFSKQRMVCLGASASGMDIAIELSAEADQVFLSHNGSPVTSKMPTNTEQTAGIARFTEDSVVFRDDREERVDSVVFCTGYRYNFPFLSDACHLRVDDGRVTPLYKQLLHTEFPSMSFIGVCQLIVPFPHFHQQMHVVLSVLDGSLQLPSRGDMDAETEQDYRQRRGAGLPHRHAHHMSDRQWSYLRELADMAKVPRPKAYMEEIYNLVFKWRGEDSTSYKKKNIEPE